MAATTVSLEWLLAQDDLGLRLVAGARTREQLTWAHASDLVDPTPWLTGGELVLTTGIGLPRAVGGPSSAPLPCHRPTACCSTRRSA